MASRLLTLDLSLKKANPLPFSPPPVPFISPVQKDLNDTPWTLHIRETDLDLGGGFLHILSAPSLLSGSLAAHSVSNNCLFLLCSPSKV